MMGLFDKLTGRARPDAGTTAQSPDQVRETLLAIADPDGTWSVMPANAGVDLVTQWQLQEPRFHELIATLRDRSHLVELQLRLDEPDHEVRVVERSVVVTERQGVFELSYERETRTGIVHQKSWDKTIGGGSLQTFDDEWLKEPLRRAVLDAGWQWHPVPHL